MGDNTGLHATVDRKQDAKADAKESAKDIQLAALLASVSVVVGFSLYWWGQIQSVLELLEMAYG